MIVIILVLKGFLLGCTAIVPGVSIGTMALVLGVYVKAINYFPILLNPRKWTKKFILETSMFFIPIIIGLLIAMVLFATIMSWLLNTYPIFVRMCFIGIIMGSIPYIYRTHVKPITHWRILVCIIIGISIVLCFSFSDILFPQIQPVSESANLQVSLSSILFATFIGVIGAAFGIIPGISGSFVLLILGYYAHYLAIVKTVILPLFIPLLLGSVLGLVLMSLLIHWILQIYPTQSYGIILGLTIGSIIGIFPRNIAYTFTQIPQASEQIGFLSICAICLVGGMLISMISTRFTQSLQQ